jgi:hypothetical protein
LGSEPGGGGYQSGGVKLASELGDLAAGFLELRIQVGVCDLCR